MSHTAPFGRLGTPAKLLIALTLVMLPIGGALVWSALRNLQFANSTIAAATEQRAALSVRAIEGLIARNALALRVAANAAVRVPAADACAEAARTLSVAPGVARQFEIEDADGVPKCANGDFSDIVQPPRSPPGAIGLWVAEDSRSLLVRTGVEGGSATARLTLDELRAALGSEGATFTTASLDDGRKRIMLVEGAPTGDESRSTRRQMELGGGRLDALVVSPVAQVTTAERTLILAPVLMWVLAGLLSWGLVHRWLITPLRKLQRGVTAIQPGDNPADLDAINLGPAAEIHDLRDAFVRAVDRIEETERGMADALDGQRKLVREVHHRVKNNLQVVASLLSIHGRTASGSEAKAAYSAIGRRVDALAVVHRNHFAELEDNQGIALRALLTELGAGLKASATEAHKGMAIELDSDHAFTTQDVAVAVAFLVTEIVEHAMLHGEGAAVEIMMRRTSALTGRLTIGSPALLGSDADTAERKQFERIVEGLARQLRSPLERSMGRYSVDLPLFPER